MSAVKTTYHEGENPGDLIVKRTMDAEPVLEYASAMRNSGLGRGKDMHLAAVFDPVTVERYCSLNGITLEEWMVNEEHVRRMLNDPALSKFRVQHKVIV